MAITELTRNLRDGALVLKDGSSTPVSLTMTLDNGDLSWTENLDTKEIKNRGVLHHTRPGDQMSSSLSFSAMWYQLISKSISASSDAAVLYEFVNFLITGMTSTCGVGQQNALSYEFTVTDPAAVASEKIVFAKVYMASLDCKEGDQTNTIDFKGTNFEVRPTITRPS